MFLILFINKIIAVIFLLYFYKLFKGFIIILNNSSFLFQFRDFCRLNKPANYEIAVKYFAYFGGYEKKLNLNKEPFELMKEHIFPNYGYIHKAVVDFSGGDNMSNTILSALAIGDGRAHSCVKRSRLSKSDGYRTIENLCEDEMLVRVSSKPNIPLKENETEISDKLYFTSPFLRFWFAFISPYFKGIKAGEYDEVQKRFDNYKDEFINLIYEQLCEELLRKNIDEKIESIGEYWDNNIKIDILAKTRSKKTIACVCKYTNAKVNKSELTKLQETCAKSNIDVDAYVIFAKKAFSSELKALKGENLKLFTIKNFSQLIDRES